MFKGLHEAVPEIMLNRNCLELAAFFSTFSAATRLWSVNSLFRVMLQQEVIARPDQTRPGEPPDQTRPEECLSTAPKSRSLSDNW